MSKKKTDVMDAMYVALMKTYNEVVGTGYCETQQEAYEKTVHHPAPRYYVNARWACQVLSPLIGGDFTSLKKLSAIKQDMYISLLNEVVTLSSQRNFIGRSLYYVVQFAIQRPAPRFYISAETMRKVFHREKYSLIKSASK